MRSTKGAEAPMSGPQLTLSRYEPPRPLPVAPMSDFPTPPPTQLVLDTGASANTTEPVHHERYYNITVPDPIVIRVCSCRPYSPLVILTIPMSWLG